MLGKTTKDLQGLGLGRRRSGLSLTKAPWHNQKRPVNRNQSIGACQICTKLDKIPGWTLTLASYSGETVNKLLLVI